MESIKTNQPIINEEYSPDIKSPMNHPFSDISQDEVRSTSLTSLG